VGKSKMSRGHRAARGGRVVLELRFLSEGVVDCC